MIIQYAITATMQCRNYIIIYHQCGNVAQVLCLINRNLSSKVFGQEIPVFSTVLNTLHDKGIKCVSCEKRKVSNEGKN